MKKLRGVLLLTTKVIPKNISSSSISLLIFYLVLYPLECNITKLDIKAKNKMTFIL